MRRKIGFKFASIAVSTPDGEELGVKLTNMLWSYVDKMRSSVDPSDVFDFAAFMLYCSYVSRNAEDLGVVEFDEDYSIDEVKDSLGNKYVASDFIQEYATLKAAYSLPDLTDVSFSMRDLSKAMIDWCDLLAASGLSLLEGDDTFSAAKAIQAVLAEVGTSDRWPGSYRTAESSPSIAKLVVCLADVKDTSVLDFACGDGAFLSRAEAEGASSVFGRDVNATSVLRSKIACFFADPTCPADVRVADAMQPDPSFPGVAQRVLVAPPFGMQFRNHEEENPYLAKVYEVALGGISAYSRQAEDFFIAKALASLDTGGVAVLHVSASLLFHQQRGRQTLRRALVDGGYVRAVIELPGGCVPGTSVKSALLVLSKDEQKEGIFIIDLDSKALADTGYVEKSRGKCEITGAGIDWLTNVVGKRKEIDMVSTLVPMEKVLKGDCNLCYSAYGTVYDFKSALEQRRSAAEIQADAQQAREIIENLSEQVDSILLSLEKKGE